MGRRTLVGQILYSPLAFLAALVAVVPAVLGETRFMSVLTLVAIYGVVAVSLDLLFGYAGQLSLGQIALFGTGAYAAAIATTTHGWPPEVGAVVGIAMAIVIAVVTGPVLRLAGFYLALATLALVLIAEAIMRNWRDVTGGSSGFVGIDHFRIGPLHFRSEADYFWLASGLLLVAMLLALNATTSRFGRGLRAIHEDERAAAALGVHTYVLKMKVWVFAAALSGAAGVVYAHYTRFLSPDQFGLGLTISVLLAVVIGGLGTVYGPVIGIIIVRLLPSVFESLAESAILLFGIAVIVVVVVAPRGVLGTTLELVHRYRVRTLRRAGAEPSRPVDPVAHGG